MDRFKYIATAFIAALTSPIVLGLPTHADETVQDASDVILVGDPDDLVPSDFVALSSMTVNPTNISVAVGEEKYIAVSYNDGFSTENINEEETYVSFKSGDNEWGAYVGFDGEYVGGEFTHDFNTVYVYGNYIGTNVYTIKATDTEGNTISKDITVTTRDALGSAYDDVEDENGDIIYEGGAKFATPIEGGRSISIDVVPMTDSLRSLDGKLQAVLDVSVKDKDGNVIPVTGNEIEVWFGIRKDMISSEDLNNFQIVYIEDGAIVEYIDPTEIEDDGWGWIISFKTTHLSYYGILASSTPFDSAENRNALLAPNTGAFTSSEEGSIINNTALIVTAAFLSFTLLATYSVVKFIKR